MVPFLRDNWLISYPAFSTLLFYLFHRTRNSGGLGVHDFFFQEKRKKGNGGKKESVSKQELLKACHQGQNVIVLAILERLEFKNFSSHGGRQYFSLLHGPATLKYILPALFWWESTHNFTIKEKNSAGYKTEIQYSSMKIKPSFNIHEMSR